MGTTPLKSKFISCCELQLNCNDEFQCDIVQNKVFENKMYNKNNDSDDSIDNGVFINLN